MAGNDSLTSLIEAYGKMQIALIAEEAARLSAIFDDKCGRAAGVEAAAKAVIDATRHVSCARFRIPSRDFAIVKGNSHDKPCPPTA